LPCTLSLRSCRPSSPNTRGEYSSRKTDSAKFFAKTKSRNFCHALRRLAHVCQVLLLRQGSTVVGKLIPRNFMRKRNFCIKCENWKFL
jgi:hypothetical protein